MMPPAAPRAIWLLVRLRLLRLLNLGGSMYGRKPKAGTSRAATAGKRRGRWILPVVMALLMTVAFTNMSHTILLNLHCELAPVTACADQAKAIDAQAVAATELAGAPFSAELMRGLTLHVTLLWLVSLLVPLGSRELAHTDWDLEWLVTLPVPRTTLLWARVLERTVTNATGMLMLWPTCLVIAWYAGLRWWAVPAATLAALALLAPSAMARTLVDTGLRLSMPPSQLRNLQAAISVAAMPLIYLTISLSLPGRGIALGWAGAFPAWTLWTPPGLVVQWLDGTPWSAALLAAEVLTLLVAGVALLGRQLAHGVVAASTREAGRRQAAGAPPRVLPGTPLQRRELRLLARDRNFLVQSLLIPIIVIGSQLFFTGGLRDMAQLGSEPKLLASVAFGLGSYVLVLSAFQTINTEGQALWMLYTFPHTLERMLREKATLWAVLALAYPAVVFAVGIAGGAQLDVHLLLTMAQVAFGIPVFALIAVALGVWACDPLAQEVHTRVRPTYIYLYMMLASLYGYGLYTDAWPHRLAVVVLLAALALALWQKARDELPFLLDPTAAPARQVSAADGMMAAVAFFAVQAIAFFALHEGDGPPALSAMTMAFAIAGAITYALTRLVYWRAGTAGVPRLSPDRALPALAWGIGCALPAIAAGLAWMQGLRQAGVVVPVIAGGHVGWLIALASIAAPLFEEFIFRGLIFNGLRRSLRLLPALAASAAVFAVIHPPLAMLPVFVLGVCTGLAFERGKGLLAPIVTHALYNGAMIAVQL
ncbi:CPBP family intramembrane glutamic endopeptidase [Pseudoduganella armeniaca]|uniref:CPBP family intramembrane metalloprotease domain-containing protein n=1 Tax=Pseudoduganella armeniaca TaxID=2072590 RepID=A0A2R4C783_9BURK|nr:CPBP family intramembrane glutamic endopeptidase [Pseudoduganella armeniaca]AVR95507.1 CPBP family intramembrane metalloprotease domain-containing protein [Pseudoduganella armeniaca]